MHLATAWALGALNWQFLHPLFFFKCRVIDTSDSTLKQSFLSLLWWSGGTQLLGVHAGLQAAVRGAADSAGLSAC